jgi:hypothetical protein
MLTQQFFFSWSRCGQYKNPRIRYIWQIFCKKDITTDVNSENKYQNTRQLVERLFKEALQSYAAHEKRLKEELVAERELNVSNCQFINVFLPILNAPF